MNTEIQNVLQQIEKYKHLDNKRELSFLTAKLQVLLAEESEKSANTIKRLTCVLTILTIIIAIFTAILVFKKPPHYPAQYNYTTKQNQTNKQMENIIDLKIKNPIPNIKSEIKGKETKRK